MKVLGMLRADASSEAGQPPTKDQMERMGAFLEEVTNAGVILSGDGLRPTKYGKRVSLEDGKFSVVDGPFTESKELVASYALLQVDSMEEAEKWTRRFLEVFGQGQCELRPIIEASDFPSDVFTAEEQAREAKTRAQMEKNARHR